MKLSDYVANFIKNINIKYVFAIQGGASAHLIDSIAKCEGIEYVCNQHEQASAMAADGYARATNNIGCAISTSGPGATNLLTGCCSAYYDSVPVLFITGQVASFRLKKDMGIRQLGFQETDTVKIFESVTKYAVLLKKPEDIRYELEKAVSIALEGRKGPVLIDIPDDFQRATIDENELSTYHEEEKMFFSYSLSSVTIRDILEKIDNAKRPLIIAGWGIHLAQAEQEFLDFMDKIKIPAVVTWGANDILEEKNILKVGTFGINGTRYGNFAVQKADLIIVLGSRLDTHVAGTPLKNFAPKAKKIIVDVDLAELNKYRQLEFDVDVSINMDLKSFFKNFLSEIGDKGNIGGREKWLSEIIGWKERYPICLSEYKKEKNVNPYVFVKNVSKYISNNSMIFCDTGCSLVWMCQAFEFQIGQRLFSSFNNTPMGYSLPAAIGAAFTTQQRVICITGDGGLQMNIQELATVVRHQLNITIFLFENQGYGMIQRTQDMWFHSIYEGSDIEHGLAFPNFARIFGDYGFMTIVIERNDEIDDKLQKVFVHKGPVCCIVKVPINSPMLPQLKFGHDLEDMEPLLDKNILDKEMEVEE